MVSYFVEVVIIKSSLKALLLKKKVLLLRESSLSSFCVIRKYHETQVGLITQNYLMEYATTHGSLNTTKM